MTITLHPLVADYVNDDAELSVLVERHRGTDSGPLEAIRLLRGSIVGDQSADGALLAAKRVRLDALDAHLCALLLATWSHACATRCDTRPKQRSEAEALLRRARSLLSAQTPPEVRVYVDCVGATLAALDGNLLLQEESLRTALSSLSSRSPRRPGVLLQLAHVLARVGRLQEVEAEISDTANTAAPDSPLTDELRIARFVNAVETGSFDGARGLMMQMTPAALNPVHSELIASYRTLLSLMQAIEAPLPTVSSSWAQDPELPDWALVIRCLLTGSVHQALRWARLCEKYSPRSLTASDCMALNLLRAELAEGNVPAAQRIIDLRRQRGNASYLDDLFRARAAILSGQMDAAADRFVELSESVERYGAKGRLAFELRLSAELPRDHLLAIAKATFHRRSAPPPTGAPPRHRRRASSQRTAGHEEGTDRLTGVGQAADRTRALVVQFAQLDVPVLITGETGTGKELVARAIHEMGPRREEPFLAINCGAISESLLESELFGHEKGAFSGAGAAHRGLFEEAGKGTILLDEIGDVGPRLQLALLRVLETNEIRPVGSSRSRRIACRILAATNADLGGLAERGQFRNDILFRLQRLEIHIPPLRERPEDIVPLALHFLNLDRLPGVRATLSPDLETLLVRHAWQGNVRELRNSVERMRLMNSEKRYYEARDIELGATVAAPLPPTDVQIPPTVPGGNTVDHGLPGLQTGRAPMRRREALRALFRQHGVLTRAEIAKTLRISPNTATKDLKALCADGFVEKVQPTASPRSVYFQVCEVPGLG